MQKGLDLNPKYVDTVVDVCIKCLYDTPKDQVPFPDFECGCKMSMALMEETGELVEAIAQRMRGRTNDNYGILKEGADVILNVLCTCKLFGIRAEDLQKAIMVKCERQEKKTDWDQ